MTDLEYSKPIFVNGRYENPFPTWKQPGILNLCKYFLYDRDESGILSQEVSKLIKNLI